MELIIMIVEAFIIGVLLFKLMHPRKLGRFIIDRKDENEYIARLDLFEDLEIISKERRIVVDIDVETDLEHIAEPLQAPLFPKIHD